MKELDSLKKKLFFLLREETEFYDKASITEAIATLIECTAYLLDCVSKDDDDEE